MAVAGGRRCAAALEHDRDLAAAVAPGHDRGAVPQRVGPQVVLGEGGFAEDTAPADALVAVPDGDGGWAVGETLAEARAAVGEGAGPPRHRRARAPDRASRRATGRWRCAPAGSSPPTWRPTPRGAGRAVSRRPRWPTAAPSAGRSGSPAPAAARELADRLGRPVRVVLSPGGRRAPRSEAAAGRHRAAGRDGTGVARVARTPGIAEAIRSVAPGLVVEEVDVPGPPTSAGAAGRGVGGGGRGARRPRRRRPTTRAPRPARSPRPRGPRPPRPSVPTARSGSTWRAASRSTRWWCAPTPWARPTWPSAGSPARASRSTTTARSLDLTIRSFGVLRAADMPPVEVHVEPTTGRR